MLRLLLLFSMFFATSCRTAEQAQNSSTQSVGIVNIDKGQKDVYFIQGDQVHFWRCKVTSTNGPYVKSLGVSGMSRSCDVHMQKSVPEFEMALTNAYLGGQKRLLRDSEKEALGFLIRVMRLESEAQAEEKVAWYTKRTQRKMSGFGKFFTNMHKAMGVTPIALAKKPVNGFNFDGKTSCEGLNIGFACPQIATPETDACIAAGGDTRLCHDCAVLCSVPIKNPKKEISGFDFGGKATCKSLPVNFACAAVVTDEHLACLEAKGSVTTCDDCGVLCSKPIKKAPTTIQGFDFDGKRSCNPLGNGACTQQVNVEEEACRDAGGLANRCDDCSVLCNVPIAKQESVSGFGMDGKSRTCKPLGPNTICTTVFTKGDQFAMDCHNAGGDSTACGCHDHICSININDDTQPEAVSGFGMDGQKRSCVPAPGDMICTQVFTAGDQYAFDCKDKGGVATKCGCHDNICSINIK